MKKNILNKSYKNNKDVNNWNYMYDLGISIDGFNLVSWLTSSSLSQI